MKTVRRLAKPLICTLLTLAAACAPTATALPPTPQTIIQTQVVTQIVAGTPEVQIQGVVITTTPEPSPIPFGEKDQLVLVHYGDPGAIADHPWTAMVEEYNRTHPEVFVQFNLVPGEYWDVFGTWLAAGNLPDVMYSTAGGMLTNRGKVPSLVDISPILDDDTVADLGSALDTVSLPDGSMLGFPLAWNWGSWVCANNALLQEAGVDWRDVYANGGWTWDEWAAAAQGMTTDANGVHAGEEGFDVNNVTTWGFGTYRGWAHTPLFTMALSAGVPDSPEGIGLMMFGNTYSFTGPRVEELLQFWQDWHTKYQFATPATLAIPNWDETYQMLIRGDMASTFDTPSWCSTMVRNHNDQIESGQIAGNPVDTELVILPIPHHPDSEPGYFGRTLMLSVFKQEPYKGDEHTQNALDLAKWLMEPERQAIYCEYYQCIPTRTSAAENISFIAENENYAAHIAYAQAHTVPTFPVPHPTYIPWVNEGAIPVLEALAKGDTTAAEADAELTAVADRLVDEWLLDAEPEIVELWAAPPEGWPGPLYPDWTIRSRDASN
jgi:hypothetical protein